MIIESWCKPGTVPTEAVQDCHRGERTWPGSLGTHRNVSAGRTETLCPVHLVGRGPRGRWDPMQAHCRGWLMGRPWKSTGEVFWRGASPTAQVCGSPTGCTARTDHPRPRLSQFRERREPHRLRPRSFLLLPHLAFLIPRPSLSAPTLFWFWF